MTSVRRLMLLAVVVVGVAFAALAAPPRAAAHSTLISTSPKQSATVTAPVAKVALTFNEAVQSKFAAVVVSDPAGHRVSTGKPSIVDETVSQRVGPFRDAGRYQVGWRVVSADGHPVSGRFSFTVRAGAVSTVTPTRSSTHATVTHGSSRRDSRDDRSFLERHAAHLVIGAVIVVVGVAVVLWERRRSHD